jgi:hypothetical protein
MLSVIMLNVVMLSVVTPARVLVTFFYFNPNLIFLRKAEGERRE